MLSQKYTEIDWLLCSGQICNKTKLIICMNVMGWRWNMVRGMADRPGKRICDFLSRNPR